MGNYFSWKIQWCVFSLFVFIMSSCHETSAVGPQSSELNETDDNVALESDSGESSMGADSSSTGTIGDECVLSSLDAECTVTEDCPCSGMYCSGDFYKLNDVIVGECIPPCDGANPEEPCAYLDDPRECVVIDSDSRCVAVGSVKTEVSFNVRLMNLMRGQQQCPGTWTSGQNMAGDLKGPLTFETGAAFTVNTDESQSENTHIVLLFLSNFGVESEQWTLQIHIPIERWEQGAMIKLDPLPGFGGSWAVLQRASIVETTIESVWIEAIAFDKDSFIRLDKAPDPEPLSCGESPESAVIGAFSLKFARIPVQVEPN